MPTSLVPASAGDSGQAGHELRDLYEQQRWSLVRLAALVLRDPADAEEVVQDAFVQAYLSWGRLLDPAKGLAYVRSCVLNRARSQLRHRKVVQRLDTGRSAAGPSPESALEAQDSRQQMLTALRSLPDRQRECLVLRYYLDLSEAEIATTLGISAGSVKTHAHRGLAALAARMEVR